ncbi:SAM-dependent methyltransferase [Sphingobacterium corticibacter]|uniref:SAM-dependent methyltransferase n=1 Tax=Sphingobacterium corticibacter TaxID=2171749 RepID=A0A2T8HK83_9SPHI|nr:SAM-dependent methyltransferase [Sphingobacterium corticibacter]PVH25851.1 SAM-dependent methyltransferase [Sphingobacterium corticibacter]
MAFGKLYLIPVPLAESAEKASYTLLHQEVIQSIDEYIVESEKTARRFLKHAGLKIPQSALVIHDYGKHARDKVDYNAVFKGLMSGKDVGLMSDAGCPGVADPGALIVAEAHKRGIHVIPLVGPSSILLALMGSGFNGQQFSFQGYLPIDKGARSRTIKDLEATSARERSTQIFIETPFRNEQLLSELLRTCRPNTRLCIAWNLTGEDEQIISQPISRWKTLTGIDLHKKPAIFLLFAS